MALYGLNYKISNVTFPLDPGSISQLKDHADAVSTFRFDVGNGYGLLEDIQINDPDGITIVDRKLPNSTSRRRILTERVLLLGIDYILSNRLFGTPSFDGRWQNGSNQHDLNAAVAGGDLLGAALFDTSPTFGARLSVLFAVLGALGTAHVRLVVVNLERLVAGAEASLNHAGFYEVKSGAKAPLGGGDYLLFVNIHQGNCWLFRK